jgi:hypothetical protein
MMLGFEVFPVNLDHIAQALKGMKRKTNRQNQGEVFNGIIPMKKPGDLGEVGIKKIEIFEDEKDRAGGNNAQDQVPFSPLPLGLLDQKGSRIIDDNGQGQNQNIDRDEGHVKDATGHQEEEPTVGLGDEEIEDRDRWKKDEE